MNFLDRLIEAISPAAGFRRAAARSATDALRLKNRYDAASPDRSLDGWWSTGASADAEIGSALPKLRARARDLGRNNPLIGRAYDLLAAKMVGTGIRPMLPSYIPQQVRERTMDLWHEWAETCDPEGLRDIYGLQHLAARTMVESGEALVRFIPAPHKKIPYVVRVIEPDWIDLTIDRALPGGGEIIQGVEYNARCERVAYWLFPEHPGGSAAGRAAERVPAEFVAAVFRATRPEQTHGVPWAVPSAAIARHLDDLDAARLARAKVQACYTAFVRKVPDSVAISTDATTGNRMVDMQPGMVEYLRPDEDITLAVPPQGEGDDEWQIMLLHKVAAGLGVTYSQLTGDLRQTNYSSMRAGMIDFWDNLTVWQHSILAQMMCQPMWRTFDRVAAVSQRRASLLSVRWQFPARQFIDPTKDGASVDAALLAGRATFAQTLAASGIDPEEHFAQLEAEHRRLADLNLPHLIQPAPVAPTPTSPPAEDATQRSRSNPQ